jgi:hypothetical protein
VAGDAGSASLPVAAAAYARASSAICSAVRGLRSSSEGMWKGGGTVGGPSGDQRCTIS